MYLENVMAGNSHTVVGVKAECNAHGGPGRVFKL